MVTRFSISAVNYLRALAVDAARAWEEFWFTPADPISLGVIRVLLGLLLLYTHATALPDLLDYIGPSAWVDAEAVREMRRLSFNPADLASGQLGSGTQSIWFYLQTPGVIWAGQALFLVAVVCFTIGFQARLSSILVWIGHLSYVQRGTVIAFGMDSIIAMLTLYLVFAPAGASLSVDRWRSRRVVGVSVAANFVLRLIQVHLCLIYLFSGLSKLHGASWWNGTAVYKALMISETCAVRSWLARATRMALALRFERGRVPHGGTGDWICRPRLEPPTTTARAGARGVDAGDDGGFAQLELFSNSDVCCAG